ncbi:MAG: aldo/keto reductase [Planctomycetota bacterium]|jgi:aryl-alcohol dehydrogenase-like predicted oxidoreductase
MHKKRVSRRQFMRDGAKVAAGLVVSVGAGCSQSAKVGGAAKVDTSKIRNYNPDMEYRRLGKTNLMVSAVALGGHSGAKQDERNKIVSRCLDMGINYIDSTGSGELHRDIKALGARRDQVYLALSMTGSEPRNPAYRTAKKLLAVLDEALKNAKLEFSDLWRITVYEPGGRHSFNTSCEVIEALEKAKKQGKTRCTGIASHDRVWFKFMIEYFPQLEVLLFPFTTMSKAAPKDSLFKAMKDCDVGGFGIKPFAARSLFTGNREENDRRARLAIRYILHSNTVIPIPGISRVHEAENLAVAVKERRELDLQERAELENAARQTLASLPVQYQWLKDWQYV